jgi:hypothetical protein
MGIWYWVGGGAGTLAGITLREVDFLEQELLLLCIQNLVTVECQSVRCLRFSVNNLVLSSSDIDPSILSHPPNMSYSSGARRHRSPVQGPRSAPGEVGPARPLVKISRTRYIPLPLSPHAHAYAPHQP